MGPIAMSDVQVALSRHEHDLRRFGVRRLRLFGSQARGDAGLGSDLDFLVELEKKTFDAYMDLKFFLEDLFGRKVDLVLESTVKPLLKDSIEREAVDVARF